MLKAIETVYKGYRFRSRLEARWAVFFDALGLPWEYEPEGFETSAGWYLPDFRVVPPAYKPAEGVSIPPPFSLLWVEVKPLDGSPVCPRFSAFSQSVRGQNGRRQNAALFRGDPVNALASDSAGPRCDLEDLFASGALHMITSCPGEPFGPSAKHAASLARQARFEHSARSPAWDWKGFSDAVMGRPAP